MNLDTYSDSLYCSLGQVSITSPFGTPYHLLAREIILMVQSYLDDSDYFFKGNDIVNQYASLVYAHGWFSAGKYLGLYSISGQEISFFDVVVRAPCDKDYLHEKTVRYHRMLSCAIESVALFPSPGSPLSIASGYCMTIAKGSLKKAEVHLEEKQMLPALGHLCFGYGWLDTAVRAGLLSINARPELFTTDSLLSP